VSLAFLAISGACIVAFALDDSGSLHEALVFLAALTWALFGCLQAAKRAGDEDWSGWWGLVTAIPVMQFIAWTVFLAVRGDAAENRFGPAAGPQSSHGDRVYLWVRVVVVTLLVLEFGALWMVLSEGLPHMNGR